MLLTQVAEETALAVKLRCSMSSLEGKLSYQDGNRVVDMVS